MTHEIDSSAKISRLADLEVSSRGSRLVIGADVVIESFVKLKFSGGLGNIKIGACNYIDFGVDQKY